MNRSGGNGNQDDASEIPKEGTVVAGLGKRRTGWGLA